ncbi:hypothetical protein CC2G_002091 [Coprinopsis cinerea AmutBmut pab1-1]|nr:hypothetical protein CC2G_002091 [Coprinopsis cinerea AmutBmut pab1-1]
MATTTAAAASAATTRLSAVSNQLSPSPSYLVVVLPTGEKVTREYVPAPVEVTRLSLDGTLLMEYAVDNSRTACFDLSAIGTPFEGRTAHVPKYRLVTVNPIGSLAHQEGKRLGVAEFWASVYAMFTLFSDQEYIPVLLDALEEGNGQEIAGYLVESGLGRQYPRKRTLSPTRPPSQAHTHALSTSPTTMTIPTTASTQPPQITQPLTPTYTLNDTPFFLSRAAFWQGAGTVGWHKHTWIPNLPRAIFPQISSFTRAENVVAKHALRPPKPRPGEVLYRRWCAGVGQMLELAYFDLDGVSEGLAGAGAGVGVGVGGGEERLSRHMAAFHRWHNDERVNRAWGEQGSLEAHRDYIQKVLADPHVLPCMFSWDGELMGYIEINYTKEDHAAPYFPFGDPPGEWDRGVHVLVGESKFLGGGRSELWLRSLVHYIFLADPRTNRVLGEPDARNKAIAKVAENADFHRVLVFDFPYKRSLMVLHARDKFFTQCKLY